jgi:hypothetical protein|tara:strand:- start:1544 stop:1720 length:177 start_codon:yes stop_codon:yes gene_type:complete
MLWTVINVIVWVIAIASIISAISPITTNKKDDKIVGKIQKLIDLLAFNVGKVRQRFKK